LRRQGAVRAAPTSPTTNSSRRSSARSRRPRPRPTALADAFLQINQLLGQEPDKIAILTLVSAVAEPYGAVPEAHFAVALAAYNTGLKDVNTFAVATREIDRALVLKPGWERGILLKSEILAKTSPKEAIAYLEGALKNDTEMRAAWGALAQLYVEQKRYGDARAIFLKLYEANKTAREFEFGAGGAVGPDEGLGESRRIACGSQERELRRERRRRALPRASRRGKWARTSSRSNAIARCPRASARGTRNCASPG
jgi:tetratricopeptide (TPR) repeat protein